MAPAKSSTTTGYSLFLKANGSIFGTNMAERNKKAPPYWKDRLGEADRNEWNQLAQG